MAGSCAMVVFMALLATGQAAFLVQKGSQTGSVIEKVITMLEDNKVKVAKDLAAEEKEMAEYTEFCDSELTTKGYAIKDSTRKIADLQASIEDTEAQIKAANDEIATVGTELGAKDKELASAESARKAEKSDFQANEKTLLASVDQLEQAILTMKREKTPEFLQTKKGKPSNKAMVEALSKTMGLVINAAWIPQGSAKVLKGFIQSEEASEDKENSDLTLHAPEEKEKSGGLMQTLEDMKTKAEETLSTARMDEMKANFNFQMVTQSITDAIAIGKKKLSESQTLVSSYGEAKGKAEGELAEAKKSKVADAMYVESLTTECQEAAESWETRQKEAKAEMEAIDKAKHILSEKVKVLVQHDDDYYNADVDDTAAQTPVRRKLVAKLRDLGHSFSSYAFAELASEAAQDPFEKVRGVIEDMIGKLVTEANEEATQHSFCQEETAKSTKEKEEKTAENDKLTNRIEKATAAKAQLTELIKELGAEVAEIDKATTEATKIRTEEKASNAKAIKDYKDAAGAVTEAIKVLKEYYAGAGAALVQKKAGSSAAPALGGNQGDAASTIVGILETSGEEFSQMYMETEADEKEAEAAYKKMMQESAVAKVAKEAEMKASESEIKTLEVSVEENKEDLKMASKELDAVLEYLAKLKPQCETKAMTYEEKKAKREQEIEGLKEALSILDASALVQTRKH